MIRNFLFRGAVVAAMGAAGLGFTAGPAHATTDCSGYQANEMYMIDLANQNISIGDYFYNNGDGYTAGYYYGLANSELEVAATWLQQYQRCNMEER